MYSEIFQDLLLALTKPQSELFVELFRKIPYEICTVETVQQIQTPQAIGSQLYQLVSLKIFTRTYNCITTLQFRKDNQYIIIPENFNLKLVISPTSHHIILVEIKTHF